MPPFKYSRSPPRRVVFNRERTMEGGDPDLRDAPLLPPPADPVLRVLEDDPKLRETGPDRVRRCEVLPLPRVLAELHKEVQDPREDPVPVPESWRGHGQDPRDHTER